MIELRPYQLAAIDQIRAAFKAGSRSVLYQLATGGGKSAIFVHVAATASARGGTVLIVVHRDELIQQTSRALVLQEIPHGIIAPDYPHQPKFPVQVASIWTLARRLDKWSHFDLVITDEAHHLPSSTFAQVHAAYPDSYRLSVTATPARLDGLGLAEHCDTLIQGPSMRELQAGGFLAPVDTYAPPTQLDLSHVHVRAGDFASNELEAAMDKAVITGSAVEHYRRLVAPRPAIAFCVTIRHCEHVADQFRKAGYKAESVDGTMDRTTRRDRIAELGAGNLNIITSCQLLTEGVDTPICQAVIMLRPTKSLTLFLQMTGRAMRPKPDGSAMLLLDHVGNSTTHGAPDIDRTWTLAGRPRGAKDTALPQPHVCEGCYYLLPPAAEFCPRCGLVVEKQRRTIAERPGDLVRMTSDQSDAPVPADALHSALSQIGETWESRERKRLAKVAQDKGYDPRWVDRVIAGKKAKMQRIKQEYRRSRQING